MNQVFFSQVFKSLKNLYSKPSNQAQRYSLKIIVLNEFIEIDRKQLKRDNEMLPKHAVIFYSNYVICIIWIVIFKMEQNLQLHSSLMLKLLFVSDNFDGNNFSCFMVNTFKRLTKRPLA
jgi:hypothetical protein